MKFASFDIVFQEIPDEVTLAINLSGCPNRCRGCHSPHLQEDAGEELTEDVLAALLDTYGAAITCVCFMGGDHSPDEVLRLAAFVRHRRCRRDAKFCVSTMDEINEMHETKTAWYSGKNELYADAQRYFDYIKLGRYIEELGGLNSPTTNQRLYRIENTVMRDITHLFYKIIDAHS